METAFVEYEIIVKGKRRPNAVSFLDNEASIKKMYANMYDVPESEIEVKEIE